MDRRSPNQKVVPEKGLPFQNDSLTILAAELCNVPYDRVTPTQRAAAKLFAYVRGHHPGDEALKSITNEVLAATLARHNRP